MFVSLMHFEVSLVVVGAVLSVLGLSLNETIIIFDRVRENERKRVPGTLADVLNRSINETLPRTRADPRHVAVQPWRLSRSSAAR